MTSNLKLSIVIPTYNRNKTLHDNIDRLLFQLREDVELKILDNASPTPVSETLADKLAVYPNSNIEIIRNKTNIGAYANILRSYEIANSKWLWILGDDDIVSHTAINDILRCISERKDATFINFTTDVMRLQGMRPVSFDTHGQNDFVAGLDHAGSVNFMSIGIWHVDSVLPVLGVAYHYAYSMSPTFVLLLSALGANKTCHFSNITLIEQTSIVEYESRWRFSNFILGWNTILELPMSRICRATLAKKMKSWHSPENVCVYLLAEAAVQNGNDRLFLIVARRLSIYLSTNERIRFLIYRVFFIHPPLGWSIVRALVVLSIKLGLKSSDLTDIVGRSRNVGYDRN